MEYRQLLKESNYALTLFTDTEIKAFETSIIVKEFKGKPAEFVPCLVRGKELKLTPEEIVRQLYLRRLVKDYSYPKDRLAVEQSQALYAEAESLLLAELGLRDWQPPDEQSAVKSFKESFGISGRLDAAYYQPKYDCALQKLHALNPRQIVPFEELLTTITNGHTPLHHDLSVGDVTFLTAEHVYDFRINFDSDKRILTEHHRYELARTQVLPGDLLITIKGRIGNAAIVETVPQPTNINQDVALLRLKPNLNLYYVAGYLNSILGKTFINQICTGQINPFLGAGNLRNIPVPLFEEEMMNKLGAKLQQTINAAQQTEAASNRLLDQAKHAVELAIEQDEAAALRWLAA